MKKITNLLFVLCITLSSIHAQSAIEFSISPNYTYRTLGTTNEAAERSKSVRNQTEKAQVNLTYGILINQQIAKNWFLQSGLKWANLGYLLIKTDDTRWPSEHDGQGGYVPDPLLPHSIKLSADDIFLEVPLQFRYEFGASEAKKLSFYLQAGFSPNIYLTTRIVQALDKDKTVTHRKNELFSTVHISSQVAGGLTYRMNKRLAVLLQPSFKYHITAIADTPVKERPYAAGVDIGLRWYVKGS